MSPSYVFVSQLAILFPSPCCTSLQHRQAHRCAGLPTDTDSAASQVPHRAAHGQPRHPATPAGSAAISPPSQTGAGRRFRHCLQAPCNRILMYKLQFPGLTHRGSCNVTYCLEYIGMNMSFSTADFILAMIAVTSCSSALLEGSIVGYSCMRRLSSPTKRSVCDVDKGSQTASTNSVGSKQFVILKSQMIPDVVQSSNSTIQNAVEPLANASQFNIFLHSALSFSKPKSIISILNYLHSRVCSVQCP